MPKPSHRSETEPHSHSRDLRWFVLEALGQEGCNVTMFFYRSLDPKLRLLIGTENEQQ